MVNFTEPIKSNLSPGQNFIIPTQDDIFTGLSKRKITNQKLEKLFTGENFLPGNENIYVSKKLIIDRKNKLPISTMMLRDKNIARFKSISAD